MNNTNRSDWVMLPDDKTAFLMWKVFPPILIVAGTVGNLLSIIVLSRKTMRRSRISRYLICLAVSDLMVLYFGLLRQWISYMFSVDIRELHPVLCKLNLWMVYFSLDLSSWVLVFVTVERAIFVWLPHKVKIICTKKVFILNILSLVIVLLAINCHFMFGVGDLVLNGGELARCVNLTPSYEHYMVYIFPWIDLCVFSILPFIFHIVGNVFMIVRLLSSARTMKQAVTAEHRLERKRQMSSMTTMLLCLNLVYLLCTLPVSVQLIYTSYWEQDTSPEAEARRTLVYACVNLLMYLNNSTNFITYTISGKRFRMELCALLRGRDSRSTSSLTFSSSVSNVSRSRHHSYIPSVT